MEKELQNLIARGRTAEVYAWEPGYILKLYHDWCPQHWCDEEKRAVDAVRQGGMPTPAALELVQVNDRSGIVFERVQGVSLLEAINQRPWRLIQYGQLLARLQVQINQLKVAGLPSYRKSLAYTLEHSPLIPDPVRQASIARLQTLGEESAVCHGDFHPGNILLTEKGPMVIDWMTVRTGSAWADVARTSLLLTVGPKGAGELLSPLVRLVIWLYHRVYLSTYLKLAPDRDGLLQRWLPVMAAARLDENITPEREALLQIAQA